MIMLILARIYQKVPAVTAAVQLCVLLHHRLRKPVTRPCPFSNSSQAHSCSNHFIRQAKVAGSMAALSGAMTAMSTCGPGAFGGVDRCEWFIRQGVAGGTHCLPRK